MKHRKKRRKEKTHPFTAFLTLGCLPPIHLSMWGQIKHRFYWVFTSSKVTTEESLLSQ